MTGLRILLMPNITKPRTCELLRELCRRMAELGMTAVAPSADAAAMAAAGIGPVEDGGEGAEAAAAGCDLLLSLGGDGTMIHSACCAARADRPVVGVNLGRLGFLAQIEAEELEKYLLRLRSGDFTRERRYAIQARLLGNGCQGLPFAINDIVFTKAPDQNLADFEILCNGMLVDRYGADGVIFSTPTGSTAYALSAGGPVMDPTLHTITMIPICPHSIAIRPIVFGGDKTITLRSGGELQAVVDGARLVTVPAGTAAVIGSSSLAPDFISFGENEFFEILTAKIKQRG